MCRARCSRGHASGGWRGPRWTAAGLVTYAYTKSEPILAYWSIAQHDVELVGVVALRPMPRRTFHLHGQLGIGATFDRLHGVDPETSARAITASIGAGAAWGPAALTFRFVIPDSLVCADFSRKRVCYNRSATAQILLSLTFDLYSMFSGS